MRWQLFFLLFIFLCFICPTPSYAAENNVEPSELIIKLKVGKSINQVINIVKTHYPHGISSISLASRFHPVIDSTVSKLQSNQNPLSRYYVFKTEEISMENALTLLKMSQDIETIEPNYLLQFTAIPNDPFYPNLWHLPKMHAPQAWDKTTGSDSVIVGIIDSGIDYNHEDLALNMWHDTNGAVGYNFGDNNTNPMDSIGHGTHMAGVIGAVGNNGIGVTGINWKTRLMAVKVIGKNSIGAPTSTIAKGIIYAADHGARVINMSFGAPFITSQVIRDAVDYTWNKGSILIASSGNSILNQCPIWFPANLPHVVAAGATDQNDNRPSFSCGGEKLALSAPSVNIISVERGGGYTAGSSGTSYSAAMVSGASALLLSSEPHLSNQDIINRLESSADDLGPPGRDNNFGYGRVNLARALGIPLPIPTPIIVGCTSAEFIIP